MKIFEFQMRFTTPAFLGDAKQGGRWRTPPIKAQLRQWWRMAWMASRDHQASAADMRSQEGALFGNAWLKDAFSKSKVRLRLERWDEGQCKSWKELPKVDHPEAPGKSVCSDLYLGYGPIAKGGLKANAAIQANESALLSIAAPESCLESFEYALWLMDRYGTLGGRSRNGWGSCQLLAPPQTTGAGYQPPLRHWKECLDLDWPHAIGKDDTQALIWQTAQAYDDWKSVMTRLAEIKINLRTQEFRFPVGKSDGHIHDRHWLSYPVTNHSVTNWGNNARLPNTLRFKVRATEAGKFVGVIFHVPHLPPRAFNPDRKAIERVWAHVHQFLDTPEQQLQRAPE